MSWDDVAGQARVAGLLRKAVAHHKLAHALIFTGPPNSGQKELALELARSLFCEQRKDGDACGSCAQCLKLAGGSHPDLMWIEREEDAVQIKIEQVKALISRANLRPFQAAAKLFVIEPADAMNETAQNALLKTLEEPEGNTFFVLLPADPNALLETIRSRSQTFSLASAESVAAPSHELAVLARSVIEHILYKVDAPRFGLSPAPAGDVIGQAPDLAKLKREELGLVFDVLMLYFRDMLLLRAGAAELLSDAEDMPEKKRFAEHWTTGQLEDRIEFFSELKEKIVTHMLNVKLALSFLWSGLNAPAVPLHER